jgi:hypothetical protein
MICSNNAYNPDFEYPSRLRDRQTLQTRQPVERFRMARVPSGPSTNQIRRRKRQPTVGGLCRRRNKKVL